MKPDKQNTLYANLMDEVKVRIDCISSAAQGRLNNYPTPIVREFCYLQLRMLCELIALSCLVAHGDITFLQPHKLGKSYSADDILDKLSKLREHFYPLPITQTVTSIGPPKALHMTLVNPSPLPKDELLKLYGITHKYLHRGSLKKLLSMDTPIDITINMPEIVRWAQKINDLLSLHVISIDAKNVMLCMLRNADENNKVQVATAVASEMPIERAK
jgi:hypothetical protein